MNKLYIFSKGLNDNNLLLVGIVDIKKISYEETIKLKCICVELKDRLLYKPSSFISQIKFGEWDDSFSDEQEKEMLKIIFKTFSEQEIEEKIIKPLSSVESIIWPLSYLVYNLDEFKNIYLKRRKYESW